MNESNTTNVALSNEGEPIQHLRLGDQELWILPDTSFVPEAGLFALEATKEELVEVLSDYGLATKSDKTPGEVGSLALLPTRFSACPILLKRESDLILIDAGIGAHVSGNPGSLPQKLGAIGVHPEEISTVLITHLHLDHIGGAFDPQSGESLFPKATFYIPEPEINFWKNRNLSHATKLPPELVELTVRTAQRAIECLPIQMFSFEKEIFPGIQPVALPGHTGGQAGYFLTSPGHDQQLLVGGDALHHPILHVRHPEWTTAGDSHPHLVHQTRLQLLNRLANKSILFRCYHFAADETGYIRKDAEGQFRFVKP